MEETKREKLDRSAALFSVTSHEERSRFSSEEEEKKKKKPNERGRRATPLQ